MAVPLTSLFVTVTPCGALLGAKTMWHIVYSNLKKKKKQDFRYILEPWQNSPQWHFPLKKKKKKDYFIHHPPMSWPPSPRCQPPGTHQRRGALWTRRWSLPSADRSPPRRLGGRVPPRCSTAPLAARDQQMAGKTLCNPECTATAAPPSREINATTSKDVCFSQNYHTLNFEGNDLLKKHFLLNDTEKYSFLSLNFSA